MGSWQPTLRIVFPAKKKHLGITLDGAPSLFPPILPKFFVLGAVFSGWCGAVWCARRPGPVLVRYMTLFQLERRACAPYLPLSGCTAHTYACTGRCTQALPGVHSKNGVCIQMIFPVLSFVSMALFVGTPCFSFRKDRHLNAYCNVFGQKSTVERPRKENRSSTRPTSRQVGRRTRGIQGVLGTM